MELIGLGLVFVFVVIMAHRQCKLYQRLDKLENAESDPHIIEWILYPTPESAPVSIYAEGWDRSGSVLHFVTGKRKIYSIIGPHRWYEKGATCTPKQ